LAFLRVFRGFWGIPRKRVIFDDFGVFGLFYDIDNLDKCLPYFLDHLVMFHFFFNIIFLFFNALSYYFDVCFVADFGARHQ